MSRPRLIDTMKFSQQLQEENLKKGLQEMSNLRSRQKPEKKANKKK